MNLNSNSNHHHINFSGLLPKELVSLIVDLNIDTNASYRDILISHEHILNQILANGELSQIEQFMKDTLADIGSYSFERAALFFMMNQTQFGHYISRTSFGRNLIIGFQENIGVNTGVTPSFQNTMYLWIIAESLKKSLKELFPQDKKLTLGKDDYIIGVLTLIQLEQLSSSGVTDLVSMGIDGYKNIEDLSGRLYRMLRKTSQWSSRSEQEILEAIRFYTKDNNDLFTQYESIEADTRIIIGNILGRSISNTTIEIPQVRTLGAKSNF